ncbi:hypothetical protein [Methylobacterium sp. JK268]
MNAPLTIKFASDVSAAQAGMQNLAASVVASMIKVSGALNTGVQANGGYLASARLLATTAAQDLAAVGAAGLRTALDTNGSMVATGAAITRTAAETRTGAAVMKGSMAVAGEAVSTNFAMIRNEAAATVRVLATSPLAITVVGGLATFAMLKGAYDLSVALAKAGAEAVEEMIALGKDAERIGVSTTFLQTWRKQALDLRVEISDLTKTLEMAGRAFAPRLGSGEDGHNDSPFVARLRQQVANGNATQAQLDRFLRASGTEEQLRAALAILQEMQGAARELAAIDLAETLFPPEIIDRLRQGRLDFEKLRDAAEQVKNPTLPLFKPEDIARSQEMQRRLDEASAKLEEAGKIFRNELYEAGLSLKEDAADWKLLMASGALGAARILRDAKTWYWQSQEGLPAAGGPGLVVRGGRIVSETSPAGAPIPASGRGQDFDDALNRLRGNLGNRTLVDQAEAASRQMVRTVRPDRSEPDKAKPKAARSGGSETDPLEAMIGQIEKSAAAIKAEVEAYGKSNAEKQIAINLARAEEQAKQKGVALSGEQVERIRQASVATAEYRDKLADLEQAERQAAETARYFGDALSNGLADAVLEGRSLGDVLMSLEKQLARSALQALFTGQGPLAGILGTAPAASAGANAVGGLFGEVTHLFRANGGPVRAGQAYTVGELGRELFVPNQDGRVVPIGRAASQAAESDRAGRARPIQVSMVVQTPDAPSFARAEAQVTAALARAVQRGLRGA